MFLPLLMQLLFQQISITQLEIPANLNINQVDYIEESVAIPNKKIIENKESIDVEMEATKAISVDVDSGAILYKKNIYEQQAIASITKLMTAMVFLDQDLDLSQTVYMVESDEREGAYNHLYRNEALTLRNLLAASLIPSDNNATIALVRSTGMSLTEFVRLMNDKAVELGLENTVFSDPTGLDENNLSTACDVAKMLYNALQYPLISELTQKDSYFFTTINTKRQVKLFSTDYLLNNELFTENGDYKILGGKTGFIDEAGYCFATKASYKNGNEVISVILDSSTIDNRFQDMKALLYWTFTNYEWEI